MASFRFVCLLCLLLLGISVAFRVSSFFHKASRGAVARRAAADGMASVKSWLNEEDGEFTIELPPIAPDMDGTTLFDAVDDAMQPMATNSISDLTLREISQCYMFSLSYLGDLVAQMGCAVPVDVETPVGSMLTGEQTYTLLQALNSLDPFETNAGYETLSVWDLADEMNLSVDHMIRLCDQESIPLPYGASTMLHMSSIEQLRRAAGIEKGAGENQDTWRDPSGVIDV